MNVAVLFTGNIRSFDQCKDNFLKEFEFLNPDYYVTTYHTRYNFRSYVGFNNDVELSEEEVKSFFSDINPKNILIDNLPELVEFFNEEKKKFDSRMLFDGSNSVEANHYLQFYKIKKALEMISDYELILGKKYDIIIRSRMDLIIKDINTLDLSNLNDHVISGYEDYSRATRVHPSVWGWNDFFMITTPQNMKNIIDNILSEFYDRTIEKSSYGFPHGVFESGVIKSNLKQIEKNILHRIIRYGDVTELVT